MSEGEVVQLKLTILNLTYLVTQDFHFLWLPGARNKPARKSNYDLKSIEANTQCFT